MKHFIRILVEGEVYDICKSLLGHVIAAAIAAHLLHGLPAVAIATVIETPATVEAVR